MNWVAGALIGLIIGAGAGFYVGQKTYCVGNNCAFMGGVTFFQK